MSRSILIDISAAVNQGAGIGRYARELTRCLIPRLPAQTARLWYAPERRAFHPALLLEEPWSALASSRSPISRRNVDRLCYRGRLPIQPAMRLGRPGDVYSPDFTAPDARGSRSHITIHDLAWFHPEAETQPALADYLAPVVKRAANRASTVFTVSETVRQEVMERYRLAEGRVLCAPNAADPRFHDAIPLETEDLVTFGVSRPFLLYVGTIEPRKNLRLLFDAIKLLPNDFHLLLVGKMGWQAEDILGEIASGGLSDRVSYGGFFPDRKLPGLMAASAGIVYPSRYEGFGLPIVEGLASGTPVAASRLAVFQEVGGDEVAYFHPEEPEDAAQAIESLLSSDSAGCQARARRKSRARSFAWDTSARIVAERLTAGF